MHMEKLNKLQFSISFYDLGPLLVFFFTNEEFISQFDVSILSRFVLMFLSRENAKKNQI